MSANALESVDLRYDQRIVNDVRLHVVEAGPVDGQPVICLHGFPEFWYSWRYQIPSLADAGYRVVAPDMRGYNRSEKPHGIDAYRLEELVGDVVGLADGTDAARVHLVGHDWGGVVAWATALERPEILESLTVMNAPHPVKYARELTLEQLARSWYALAFQLPWVPEAAFAARDYAALEAMFTDERVDADAFSEADIERYKAAFRRPGAMRSAISYYRALLRHHTIEEIPAAIPVIGDWLADDVDPIAVPTLVIWGERDVALSTSQLEGLDRYVRELAIERYSDASHWVNVDRPAAVNDQLCTFLDAV